MSVNHKAEARRLSNIEAMNAARLGTDQASVRIQVAQVHATLALVDATDALAAAQRVANLIEWYAQGRTGLQAREQIDAAVNL